MTLYARGVGAVAMVESLKRRVGTECCPFSIAGITIKLDPRICLKWKHAHLALLFKDKYFIMKKQVSLEPQDSETWL